MKQKSPSRTFIGLAKTGSKHTPVNSGIFSNSSSSQKNDPQPKPCYGKKANDGIRAKAVDTLNIKVGMTHTKAAKSASAVQKYALK